MEKGDVAPDFELPDENGQMRRLSDLLKDGPVVLYFYPAAMTYGCTKESCHFRDLKSDFDALGAQRIGISGDKVEKQKQFSDKHRFDFPLLSDVGGVVADQFGAKRNFGLAPTKRMTFIIDTDRKLLDVIKSETRMGIHGDRALEVLKQRANA